MSRSPLHVLVSLCFERFQQLANPVGGQASPVATGAPLDVWSRAAGVGSSVHGELEPPTAEVVRLLYQAPLDTGGQIPSEVAKRAMRRMVKEAHAEPIGRGRYRSLPNQGIPRSG